MAPLLKLIYYELGAIILYLEREAISVGTIAAILAKIYETNFSVSVKSRITGKVQFQFLKLVYIMFVTNNDNSFHLW